MVLQWGQIVTQIIGFLVAVWLLRRYAWEKILSIIEQRREKIALSFKEIEQTKTEAEVQRQKYEKELENIESLRRAIIQDAAREANQLASEIKEDARREAVAMREKAKEDIAREVDKANAVLRDQMVEAVITTTEKVIRERLDDEKHSKLIEDFLKEAKVE
ncbi:MAG: F0F1 ATP synthase subunit B [Candidatus Latescibacteria bacterium]|nr:F0F1 ATP synthase subunit B [Candidatus Latescibacterota bacterium]NIM21207.1 F0F1 ATP synthase subunit B [Candidatus Latescibacterota bacterium]NIM65461.1 F0F1 ATP synthase subunit B [Candidatus Latescibacterota bacterium]NIO01839.1 F0F1 ATP synthase subunit B [Candidatus Latescibacterota bacterium]NIO28489.1 F0F1 ATP synthase subunit B [Candidatus Latescibacterota bacterium]